MSVVTSPNRESRGILVVMVEKRSSDAGRGVDHASVQIKTHTWSYWLENAYEAEQRAHDARGALIDEIKAKQPRNSTKEETRWSMRAISESANAIEALVGDVLDAMGADEVRLTPAWKRIMRNVECGTTLLHEEWSERLHWLFELRNDTVHAKPRFAAPEVHPLGGDFMGNVGADTAVMTCENATKAVDVAEAFITAAVANPRDDPMAQRWGGHVTALLHAYLLPLRRREAGSG